MIHPDEALVDTNVKVVPTIPVCEHFCGNKRFAWKALEMQNHRGPVFDITFDLEDGAPKGREQENLDDAIEVVSSFKNQFNQVGVRIHDYHNEWWKKEVGALMKEVGHRIAYVTIPKVYNAQQLLEMTSKIQGMTPGRVVPIHVIIETQAALDDIQNIAKVKNGLQVLDFGLMDFTADYQGTVLATAMESPMQFDHRLVGAAKAETVRVAILNGLIPSHNVTLNTDSHTQAYEDASRARTEFGFRRMWSISPTQVDQIINGMKAGIDADHSCGVLMAAQDAAWGPIKYEGKLEDRATYRYHWSMVKQAKAMGIPLPEKAEERFFATAAC